MAPAAGVARRFRDLPLWAKVLIAPAACCMSGIAVAASIWFGAIQAEARLAEIADRALPTTAASQTLLQAADHVQAMAMRTLVWQQAGMPDAQVAALGRDTQTQADGLQRAVAGMIAARAAADPDQASLHSIEARAAECAKVLADAIDLVSDPGIAVGYFRRADTMFDALREEISSLSAQHRAAEVAAVQAARADSHATMMRFLWISGTSVLILLLLLPVVVRAIAGPVRALTNTMTQLAAGHLEADIHEPDRGDELGGMARAVRVFRQHAIDAALLAAEQTAAQAAKEQRRKTITDCTTAFGGTVTVVLASLMQASDGMHRAADALADAAMGVRTRAGSTAASADVTAHDLDSVGTAVAQLTDSVGEISRQVAAASKVAQEAVQRADASHAKIRGLADATSRIGDVVRLINAIAGQTNLLALNATIEAARAGTAGKGFAVVAGEVKALATQTERATADISQQIAAVRTATEEAVQAMAEVGHAIGRMDAVTGAIAAAVEQQGTTSRQIAASMTSVSQATGQTTQAMRHLTEVADSAGSLSANVLHAATDIGHNAETLRAEVDQFLAATAEDGAAQPAPVAKAA